MTVIVETTSLAEEIVFRDIIRIEDKEEWIVLNDKNGRCLPMPKQGIENIKVLDILTKIIDDDEVEVWVNIKKHLKD